MKKILWVIFFHSISILAFAQGHSTGSANRPQTPRPPFGYILDSVEYDNADKTVHFGATFTYPNKGGPFVAAVMITGSGLQDRDETIFDHKPFAVIANYLTSRGIAVLRVDDRNMGKSRGEIKNATSADFADDVMASIGYLEQRKEVNKNKIGLIGHSEGGFIAPMVYSKWNKLAFIISLAGTGVSGAEILLKQQTDGLRGLVDSASFHAFYLLTEHTLSDIHDYGDKPDSLILSVVKKTFTDWKASLADSVLRTLHADLATPEMYAAQITPELIPWLKYFISTDPDQFWQKVKCPVLALNGQRDIQVYADQNIPAITASLKKSGNTRVTTIIFPGLNHLFQHCTKCTVAEYNQLEETFAPEVLQAMGDWIQKNIQ
jgi:pimeloyl-ACP methyl ester carboxylesterase